MQQRHCRVEAESRTSNPRTQTGASPRRAQRDFGRMNMFKNHVTRKALEEIRFGERLVSTLQQVEAPESIWKEIQASSKVNIASKQKLHWLDRLLATGFAFASVLILSLFLHSHAPGGPAKEELPSWEVASVRGTPQI